MAFGRFERTPGQTPMSEINVTPLVDVMMVLLVIFIITAPLMVSALKLDLPKTEGAQASSAPPRFVKLSIDAKGEVFLDDKALSLDDLRR
ncbi:MAG: biopolymer transporter ExbD, partial [Limnohabitans sp.]